MTVMPKKNHAHVVCCFSREWNHDVLRHSNAWITDKGLSTCETSSLLKKQRQRPVSFCGYFLFLFRLLFLFILCSVSWLRVWKGISQVAQKYTTLNYTVMCLCMCMCLYLCSKMQMHWRVRFSMLHLSNLCRLLDTKVSQMYARNAIISKSCNCTKSN